MIQLDQEFTTTEASQGGGFEPPPAGGHILRVLAASDTPSKAGNDMVTISLDIAEGEFAGAFEKYPKKFFQLVNGDHLAYFKGMLKSFEESNPPAKMKAVLSGLQFNPEKLVGLLIGACLRETEYIAKDGSVGVGLEIWYLCPVSDVPEIKVPALKKLPKGTAQRPQGNRAPPPEDDNLPF